MRIAAAGHCTSFSRSFGVPSTVPEYGFTVQITSRLTPVCLSRTYLN